MTIRVAGAAALVAAAAFAQQPAGDDVTRLGPQVGARVADFTLKDHRGVDRSVRSVAGSKGTMLVFFRSADW
jgi:hypothetical protein